MQVTGSGFIRSSCLCVTISGLEARKDAERTVDFAIIG